MADTSINLCGLKLKNPVMPASGTYGFGLEFAEIYDLNILGAVVTKGMTKEKRSGNPNPRIAETPNGMLNSVGLINPGIDSALKEEIPKLASLCKSPIIANVCGFSAEEYIENCKKASDSPYVSMIELNVSCPNVKHGGMSFGTDEHTLYSLVKEVRKTTKLPISVKLTPNVTDITAMALSCESAGADAVTLINTLLGMRIDIKTRRPVMAAKRGGLSGKAVFPVALRAVYDVYEKVKIPIIGVGGIASACDVLEMMMAGATAVQIGTANLTEPYACKDIIENLPIVMEKLGISSISEIIGMAH